VPAFIVKWSPTLPRFEAGRRRRAHLDQRRRDGADGEQARRGWSGLPRRSDPSPCPWRSRTLRARLSSNTVVSRRTVCRPWLRGAVDGLKAVLPLPVRGSPRSSGKPGSEAGSRRRGAECPPPGLSDKRRDPTSGVARPPVGPLDRGAAPG